MEKEYLIIACWSELNCTNLKWIALQGSLIDTGFKIAKISMVLFIYHPIAIYFLP